MSRITAVSSDVGGSRRRLSGVRAGVAVAALLLVSAGHSLAQTTAKRQAKPAAQPSRALPAPARKTATSASAGPATAAAPAPSLPGVGGAKLVWNTDFSQAMKLAKDQNKLILVDVYTDWCGWCHKLDRDTYSNPEVVKFVNGQFVCLKLDAEDGGPGQAFAQQYQIGGFPCIMMLDSAGKMKGVFYGYRNAAQFPDAVKTAMQKGAQG